MGAQEILEMAMALKASERFTIADRLLESLDPRTRRWMPSGTKRQNAGWPPTTKARHKRSPWMRRWIT